MELGEMIKFIRETKGLTLQEVADLVGYSKGSISQFETGARDIPVKFINAFRTRFKVNPNWWEDQTGPMFVEERNTICDNVVDLGSITEAIELKRRGVLSTLPEDIRESVALESQQELVRKIAALETELATRKQIEAALVNDNQKKALVIENLINGELLAEEPKEQQPVVKKLQKNSISTSSKKVSKSL